MPPTGAAARRRRSPSRWPPMRQTAKARSYDITRPLRPRWATQRACRPSATLSRIAFERAPPGDFSSGALKSARRTSIQPPGSFEGPTHKLSPSPTYRTVPSNVSPARRGSSAVQASACAMLDVNVKNTSVAIAANGVMLIIFHASNHFSIPFPSQMCDDVIERVLRVLCVMIASWVSQTDPHCCTLAAREDVYL